MSNPRENLTELELLRYIDYDNNYLGGIAEVLIDGDESRDKARTAYNNIRNNVKELRKRFESEHEGE